MRRSDPRRQECERLAAQASDLAAWEAGCPVELHFGAAMADWLWLLPDARLDAMRELIESWTEG